MIAIYGIWDFFFNRETPSAPLGLFSGIDKHFGISLSQVDSPEMFRLVAAHEINHLFGDMGLGLLPRDSLYADAYASFRVIQVHGEEKLIGIYRSIQRKHPTALPRERALRLATRIYSALPTHPMLREKKIRQNVMSWYPQYQFLEHPLGDGDKPWVYLYGTATGIDNRRIATFERNCHPFGAAARRQL